MAEEGRGCARVALPTPRTRHRQTLEPPTIPRKPVQNAFIESFNGKFRDECLNEHWLVALREAQLVIEAWWRVYWRAAHSADARGVNP